MNGRSEPAPMRRPAASPPEADAVYRTFFEHSPQPVLLLSADGRCIDASAAACALLGVDRAELAGRAVADFLGDELPRWEEVDSVRFHLRQHGDRTVPVHARPIPLDATDSFALVLDLVAESAGEVADFGDDGFRALVEHLPVVTYLEEVHPDGSSRRAYTSPQIEALVGVTPAEWSADPTLWQRLLHHEDYARVLAEDARSTDTGEPFRCDYRLRARDGRTVWVRDRSTLIETRPDNVQIWHGVALDISEEKRIEEALRRSDTRFRALVQYAADIVAIVDGDGVRRFVSPSVQRILGYDPAELIGTSILDDVAPDDLARFRDLWNEVAARPSASLCDEVRVRHKDGSWRWMETTATNLLDDPHVAGIVVNAHDVSERKVAEAALRQAEKQARRYLEQLPVLVYVQRVDDPDQTTYVNPWCENLFGLDPAAWSATWKDRVHPDDRAAVEREVGRTDATGEPFRLEYRERTADGRYLWVRDEAVLVRDEGGAPRYWIGAKVDVSSRRETEAALRASEALYRSLVEDIPAAVYLDAPDRLGKRVYASPRIATLLGYHRLDWPTDPDLWTSCIHPDDRQRVLAEYARSSATGDPLLTEFRYVARDGRVVWVRDEAVLVRDEQGKPRNWYGVVVDVTERRAAEELLREAEGRFRSLVEQLPAVVSIHAPDAFGSTLYVSPQFERVFGYTAEDVAANPRLWWERTHPDDLPRVIAEMERAAAGDGRMRLEYRQRTRDGRWLWQREESVLLREPSGAPRYWQTVLTDITDLKLAQEASDEANALKSTFLSSMSHELRTPLNAIIGHAHLLLDGFEGPVPADQRPAIETIAGAADHLLALIDDVLDLSRIEAEALDLAREPINVLALVDEVFAALRMQAGAKGLSLVADIAPDLTIEADPLRFRQIFLNLVGNAVKFSERGEVRVAARSLTDGVQLSVADEGIGIAPTFLPYVFDEFRQADASTTRRFGGSGLGLAIVRRLVELHGGTIEVESEQGVGSTFSVWLPAPNGALPATAV